VPVVIVTVILVLIVIGPTLIELYPETVEKLVSTVDGVSIENLFITVAMFTP
jgi:hypothetical protein